MPYDWTSLLPSAPAPVQLNTFASYYDPVKSKMNALAVTRSMNELDEALIQGKINLRQWKALTHLPQFVLGFGRI